MSPGKVRLVLHRPSSADNLGAAARVLKNFGFSRLAVVTSPAWEGLPRSGEAATAREEILLRARRLARRASDVLEAAEFHPDLRGALGAATWTCGTTSRELPGRPRLSPRQLAAEVAARSARGEVAVVFGEEKRGLSDRELDLCQAVCSIPTHAAYDSMNLAQAVAVVSYECSLAFAGQPAAAPPALPAVRPEGDPARHATLEALWGRLGELLSEAGYLNPQNPELILAEWRHLLGRADPTQREVELLLAGVKAVQRSLARGP